MERGIRHGEGIRRLEGMESWELADMLEVSDMLEVAHIPEGPDIVDPRTELQPHETVYCVNPYISRWQTESGVKNGPRG